MFEENEIEDVVFKKGCSEYVIKDVPCVYDEFGRSFFKFNVGVKVKVLKEEMLLGNLKQTINYNDY